MVPRVVVACLCLAACYYQQPSDDDQGPPDARPQSTCTCDVDRSCSSGCVCDPDCGMKAIGAPCRCGPSEAYCSDTSCGTHYCLWMDGGEGYCSQSCGSCPVGFECVDFVGVGSWCQKMPSVPNCGACIDSSDCQSFYQPTQGVYIKAACFDGRCRKRCLPGSSPCDCLAGTPAGGTAQGYCRDDGC